MFELSQSKLLLSVQQFVYNLIVYVYQYYCQLLLCGQLPCTNALHNIGQKHKPTINEIKDELMKKK